MMNTCNVVKDLMPLYLEELTNADSSALVERHLDTCAACKQAFHTARQDYKPDQAAEPSEQQIDRLVAQVSRYQNKIKLVGVLVAMMLSCVMTGAEVQLMSTMPLLIFAPFFSRLFYQKSWPILLSAVVFGAVGGALSEHEASYIPVFTAIAFLAACVGTAMAVLMKRGMSANRTGLKAALVIPAAAVLVASCIGYFSFFGNPVGYVIAMAKTKAYVNQTYEADTLTFVGVGYNFKNNRHFGKFEYVLNGSRQMASIWLYPNGQVYDQYKEVLEDRFLAERSEAMRAWIAASIDYAPVAITAAAGEELQITRDALNERYDVLSYDKERRDSAAAMRRSESGKLDYVISFGEFADELDTLSPEAFQAKAGAIRDALEAHNVPFRSVEVKALGPDGQTLTQKFASVGGTFK